MSTEPSDRTARKQARRRRRRFQFSLRTMLIIVSVVAACCSGLFSGYGWLASLTGLVIVMLTTIYLVTVLAYGRGNLRAFSLAALCPFGLTIAFVSAVYCPYLIVAFFASGQTETDLNYGIYISAGLAIYFT